MKHSFTLFLFLSLTPQFIYADIHDYYNHIQKAEHLLIQGNYKDAIPEYQSAFSEVRLPFSNDLFNALVCVNKHLDNKNIYFAVKCGLQLKQLGCENRFFQQEKLKAIVHSPIWNTSVTRKNVRPDLDITYRNEIIALFNKDQKDRVQRINDEPEEVVLSDYEIAERFRQLIETKGFPGEARIGVFVKSDTTLVLPPYHIILLHHFQKGNEELTGHLKAAVVDGKIPSSFLSGILVFSYTNNIGGFLMDILIDKIYIKDYTEEELSAINRTRSEFLLFPYEQEVDKLLAYQFGDHSDLIDFCFFFAGTFKYSVNLNFQNNFPMEKYLKLKKLKLYEVEEEKLKKYLSEF